MKKTIIVTACTLLFCGGLFCLYLVAEPEVIQSGMGALVFDDNDTSRASPLSLLDRKLDECCERELLELKVAACQKFLDGAAHILEAASRRDALDLFLDAQINLAAAKIELHRYTGEQEKILDAHKTIIEARTEKLHAATARTQVGVARSPFELRDAEIQLLDALLEQKRILAALNGEE